MRVDGARVLIVGAGIAGLAAARTLHASGAAIEIVERAGGPTSLGTGIYLPGNAVRALGRLGLGAQVAELAMSIERQHIADHRGRTLFDVEADAVWNGVGPCLALHRADLHRVLLTGVGDVPVTWGHSPREIIADEDAVRVTFSDDFTQRYDLVLGADGLHSMVRRTAFNTSMPRPVGQYARRFVIAGREGAAIWSVMLGHNSSFLTIPIGGDRIYCYCDGPPTFPPQPLRELLAGYAEPVPAVLEALESSIGVGGGYTGPVEEVVLDSWSRGAVLLIGDAAHATSPNMAQGAAMALEDAIVLGESLTTANNIFEGIAAYERRRRPRTDWVLRQTHRRDDARSLPSAVRNLVLSTFGRRIFLGNYRPLREQI